MADIILVGATLAFIAICVGYVHWCDRIIGPDDFGSEAEPAVEASSDHPPDVVGDIAGDQPGERDGVRA